MKNKLSNRLWKTISISLLTVILTVGVLYVTETDGNDAYAADVITTDVTPENVDYKLIKYSDISAYREKDATTDWYGDEIPQYNDSNGDWLFAGWYSDDKLSGNIGTDKTSGEAVAKFVPADVLSVKCQISKGTDANSDSTVLRCVSSVDTLKYNYIGFDLTVPEDSTFETENMESDRVGSRIEVAEENAKDAYAYSPKVIDTESEYFFSATYDVVKSDKETFDTRYFVQPYWITKDGTKVYGVSRYVTVNEGITKKTIHATVKMEDVTCGMSYDGMSYDGSEAPTLEKINHDGTYAYYAITVPDKTVLNSVTKFNFYDTDDNLLGTYYYRNLLKTYNGENADQSWYTAYEETTEDEFVIATSADLYGLTSAINGDHTFVSEQIYVVSDIVANKGKATEGGWDKTQVEGGTDYPWTAEFKEFNGMFDGQGHTLSGINATATYRSALFQRVGANGIIKNFTLTNSYMASTNYAGSIAGRLDGVIKDVVSDAIVKGSGHTNGGLVGLTYAATGKEAQIENCVFAGSVYSPNNFVGGIVGARCLGNLKIVDCDVTGSVSSGKNYAGGMLGGLHDLDGDATINANNVGTINIENCKFQGQLSGAGECLGGLVGALYGRKETLTIKDSTVAGTLTGGYNFGGVIGYTGTGTTNISGCTVTGTITTTSTSLGGVVGTVGTGTTNVEKCTVSGTLTAGNYFGGIIGRIPNGQVNVKACAVTSTLKPSSTNIGGIIGYITGGTSNVKISENSYFAGKIETSTARSNSGGLVGSIWNSATVNITDCHANSMTAPGDYCGGLVGAVVSATANINNSYFNGDFSTKYNYSGGILGYSSNGNVKIDKCYFNGTYNTNYQNAGGIVGYITAGTVDVANSYFEGKFDTSAENAGGIVGNILNGTLEIEKSYFDGAFTSTTNYAGGIVGTIGAVSSGCDVTVDIKSCYAKGTVSANGSHIGGIVGRVTYLTNKTVSLTDCLNAASVSGGNWTGGLFGRTHKTSGTIKMTRCLNMGAINSSSSSSAGSAVGGADQAPTVEAVYAVINNTVSKACGNNTFAVTTCELKDITVGNGVTAEKIKTETLSGLFGAADTVWTIGTTEGSTPKLDLTRQ